MSNGTWSNALPLLLLVLLRFIPSRVLIGIEFIPSEIWVPFGRVIVQRCSTTQISEVTVNTLNRYKIMLRHISDKWVILLMVVLWTVVIAVADMNWPSHMGDQNVLVDAIFGKLS